MSSPTERAAIAGGQPVREEMLPYGTPWVNEDDRQAVLDVLRTRWLTTGPALDALEHAFAEVCGVAEAVAVSNGTAALHCAMAALGVGPGDEVVVPPLSFAASANCVLYQGATPVFADVDPATLLLDPAAVGARLSPRTKAIIAVDYAGQPCDYVALSGLAAERGVKVVADACHALGATSRGRPVGSLADLSTFSLHPVKAITAGEGGVITTDDPQAAERMRRFRSHGMSSDFRQRERSGSSSYEMIELGFNYRLTDIQAALARSQLRRLNHWVERRRGIAARYDAALASLEGLRPLSSRPGTTHARHLYVIEVDPDRLGASRDEVFRALRAEGIGVVVHYPPIHLHPYYRRRLGTAPGLCPIAEAAAGRILSLPCFPRMSEGDVEDVLTAVEKVWRHYLAA